MIKRIVLLSVLLLPVLLLAQVEDDDTAETSIMVPSSTPEGNPFLISWAKTPEVGLKAQVRKISYNAKFDNNFIFRGSNILTVGTEYSLEDYRRQEKEVEIRNGSLSFSNNNLYGFRSSLSLSDRWKEDRNTNSGGITNINNTELKNALVSLTKDDFRTGDVDHTIKINGKLNDQSGVMMGQRNNFSEAQLNAGVASGYSPRDWLSLKTGLYAMTETGDRALGQETNPSSAGGDSLRAGAFYDKSWLTGGFTIKQSSFNKKYLDYRRNTNGIIDTIGVEEKIVQELEKNDAISIAWDNKIQLSRFSFKTKLSREVKENSFRASNVGTKERQQDKFTLNTGFRITEKDSIKVSYGWLWKWDDQKYQGADASRGKQISKRRDMSIDWQRNLFEHTLLKTIYNTSLAQEEAIGGFNTNDRDRLDSSLTSKLETTFDNGNKVTMTFDYKHLEDLSIRREKSANNNIKDSYEISPGYFLPISSWLSVSQDFRVWIQYTDYVYSNLENVNKDDGYNKRGNLNTIVRIKPNNRISIVLKNDYSIKSNAIETNTDAMGNGLYNREQQQQVNKVDIALTYKASNWLTLDATTFKTGDEKERYGASTTYTDKYSGELKVGGIIRKDFGSSKLVDATIRKVFAYGPNVQPYSSEYWDADIKFSWRF